MNECTFVRGVRLMSCALLICTAGAAAAEPERRSGIEVLAEWTDPVKTAHGKEQRTFRTVYDWDTGAAYRESRDAKGVLVSRTALEGAPSASEAEIASAIEIVRDDAEVREIMRRQGGVVIEGGFVMRQEPGQGPCTGATRCVQIFLFDGDNVVRHMLVDLRTSAILERDYIPPRNRAAREVTR